MATLSSFATPSILMTLFVKRVIGVPGDRIRLVNKEGLS